MVLIRRGSVAAGQTVAVTLLLLLLLLLLGVKCSPITATAVVRGPVHRSQGGTYQEECYLQDSSFKSIVIITIAVYCVIRVGGGIVADRS